MVLKTTTLALILVLETLITSTTLSSAQISVRPNDDKFSETARDNADQRTVLIDKELRKIRNHEWAGKYYYGNGLGVNVNLALAPKSGFVFTWRGCLGLYDLNYGEVRFENGLVKLVFTYENEEGDFHGIAPEFYPVSWGERHYLIPSDEIIRFCNAVNSGAEPCNVFCSRFLLRVGDRARRVEGQPSIPSEFSQYLLAEPILANIVTVERNYINTDAIDPELKFRISEVTLDAGLADGILLGMELHS
jgi:hypothetical protein